MSTLVPLRPYTSQSSSSSSSSSKGKQKQPERTTQDAQPIGRAHEHGEHDEHDDHAHPPHSHAHAHSHSHSVLGSLAHTHSHAEDGHADAEEVVKALRGGGDRGSRITLIGLAANVALTVSKGTAGWFMNSASLLADAGHTAGDLIGDLITLFCWKLSRRPPSDTYPYGFGKFEVLGSTAVSLLLTGGALGLGLHSLSLLAESLSQAAATLPAGPLHDVLVNVTDLASAVPEHAHVHAHTHAHALDPNAAWFAAAGVLAKEWLFRATKTVAEAEGSPVLLANAYHHRSDGYSSLVALVAILGTWWFPHMPLDAIGGLVVSVLIVQQGWAITVNAFRQLTDASVSPGTKTLLLEALQPLLPTSAQAQTQTQGSSSVNANGTSSATPFPFPPPSPPPSPPAEANLLAIRDLRAMRAGALMFVDLTAEVPRTLSVADASALEGRIARALREARKEVAEVRVRFQPAGSELKSESNKV